jgi:D-apionolactonase
MEITSRRGAMRMLGTAMAGAPAVLSQEGRPLEKPVEVRCGVLTFLFDPVIGFVRHVKWNGIEVLNGIYAAVRDENWGTVPAQISNITVETEVDVFKVVFDAVCKQGGIEYWWRGSINGAPRALTFEFDGEAKTTFQKNRLGFVVLHPLRECSGKPVKIEHVDGNRMERGIFPDLVSPHQPFKDIKFITHEIYPGLSAEVRFSGDTFEMEDHRNWTDANFKTYCTPLSNPFPVEVKQGEKLVQSVSLRLVGSPKPLPQAWAKPAKTLLALSGKPAKIPAIGFGTRPGLSAADAALLKILRPAHLRAVLTSGESAVDLKLPTGVPLEAVLSVYAESEVAAIARALAATRIPAARYAVIPREEPATSQRWLEMGRKHLPKGSIIGAGTLQNFAELNRNRPDAAWADFVTFPVNPQVHAFDDMSILENTGGQSDAVRTAQQFSFNKPVAVSPVTLRPNGAVDPRQRSLVTAAWTAASLEQLSAAASVTYFETHGPAGLMDGGRVYPAFHVFAALVGYSTMESAASGVDGVSAFVLRNGSGGMRLVIANLTNEVRLVDFRAAKSPRGFRVQLLDTESVETFASRPLDFLTTSAWNLTGTRNELALLPYGVAVLTAL